MIRAADKTTATLRGVLNWAAAFVLVLNAIAFGFATGAMADVGASSVLSVICGSADDGAVGDGSAKLPAKAHCVACAILHSSSAIENDLASPPVRTAPYDAPPTLCVPVFRPDEIHIAPELRLLCSRAPPGRNV